MARYATFVLFLMLQSRQPYLNADDTITIRPCAFFDDERQDRVVSPYR
jgi:hypothetical protein